MAILSFPSQAAQGVGALTWRGRNVARGGLGLVRGLGKEQELHVDLYLVWGRSRGSACICIWSGEKGGPAVVVELQRSWQDLGFLQLRAEDRHR